MVVGVGDEQFALVPFDADGVLQADVVFHTIPVSEGEEIDPNQSCHATGSRIYSRASHAAGFRIGEIQDRVVAPVLADDDAAGLRQRRLSQWAVVDVLAAGTGVGTHHAVGQ